MKKITIGIVALFSLYSISGFAAPAVASKDASIPCYNGGYTFGLAGYETQASPNAVTSNPASSEFPDTNDNRDSHHNLTTDYR